MEKTIEVTDLGTMAYREAWAEQERIHESVLNGGPETILLVEHLPVVTLGRREDSIRNLVTSPDQLQSHGVDLVHSDRGGDITFHSPGQIVAYPIIRLNSHGFSVGGYVHRLEAIVIAALKEIGIEAQTDPNAVGVWAGESKICAIGVRIRRGISLHGLALNVEGDLSGFAHIIPCGLTSRGVTSIRKILGDNAPSIAEVKKILTRNLLHGLA